MRDNIYYWKCDSPLKTEDKKALFFKDKYKKSDITSLVEQAVRNWCGDELADIRPAGCDGNHFAYIITLKNGERYFFRGDEGCVDDDYMIAEDYVLDMLSDSGVPVPHVYASSHKKSGCPINYQILSFIDTPCLNDYYKKGELDIQPIATQLGQYLKLIHATSCDGFGFFNTDRIKRMNTLVGLDHSYRDYFYKRLDCHLGYLEKHDLLRAGDIADIRAIFKEHDDMLNRQRGVLVHRDIALWNILGTQNQIHAIIDWDDCVSGDPADDLGMINCFFEDEFMVPLLNSYSAGEELSDDFQIRIRLHKLRNMLWKCMIRHYMGYFEKSKSFFLINETNSSSLKEFTLSKIMSTINYFRESQ